MKSGIYFIKNIMNNKIYIGRSINIPSRLSKHKYYLRNNKHHNKHLQNSFNKYGESNFKFLKILEAEPERLPDLETIYINFLQTNTPNKGYNKTDDGGGYSKELATRTRFDYYLVDKNNIRNITKIESIQDIRDLYKHNYTSNVIQKIKENKYYCNGFYILENKTGCDLITVINKHQEATYSPGYFTVDKHDNIKEWNSLWSIATTLSKGKRNSIERKKVDNKKYSFYKHKIFSSQKKVQEFINYRNAKRLQTQLKEYKKLNCILENDTLCHMYPTFKQAANELNLTYSLVTKRLAGIKGTYHKGYKYYYRPIN